MRRPRADDSATLDDGVDRAVAAYRRCEVLLWRSGELGRQINFLCDAQVDLAAKYPGNRPLMQHIDQFIGRAFRELRQVHREIDAIDPVVRAYLARCAAAERRARRTRDRRREASLADRWRIFAGRIYAPPRPWDASGTDYVKEFLTTLVATD